MSMTAFINLDPFCAKPGGRYDIDKPFVIGGWRYASDGAIMVRVPAEGEPDTGPERKVPRKAEECFPKDYGQWLKFPAVRECPLCAGSGSIDVPCPHCGQDIEECRGCKKKAVHLQVGAVSRYYAALIANLPNVRYVVAKDDGPIYFRFDGGEGVICQLKAEEQGWSK